MKILNEKQRATKKKNLLDYIACFNRDTFDDASIQGEQTLTNNETSSTMNWTELETFESLISSCYIYQSSRNLAFDNITNEERTNESSIAYYTRKHPILINEFLRKFSNEINSMCLTKEKTDRVFGWPSFNLTTLKPELNFVFSISFSLTNCKNFIWICRMNTKSYMIFFKD